MRQSEEQHQMTGCEIGILSQVYEARTELFEADDYMSFDPFLQGLGLSLARELDYHLYWHGPFHSFICEKYNVLDWDVVDAMVKQYALDLQNDSDQMRYTELLARYEEKCEYKAINYMNVLCTNRTARESFYVYFDLLREYEKSIKSQCNEVKINPKRSDDYFDFSSYLLKYEKCLGMLIGEASPFRLKHYIRGYIWGRKQIVSDTSFQFERFCHFFCEHGYLLDVIEKEAEETAIKDFFSGLRQICKSN